MKKPRLKMLEPMVKPLKKAGPALVHSRSNSTRRGYGYRWQRYRESWLQSHPVCGDRERGRSAEHSECARSGRVSAATDVDHIKRVTGPDDPLFWEPSNHQSLCHVCHSLKTVREANSLE